MRGQDMGPIVAAKFDREILWRESVGDWIYAVVWAMEMLERMVALV